MSEVKPPRESGGDDRLAFYWRILQQRWRTIVRCTLLAPIITLLVSVTLVPRSYRAEAAVKPMPTESSFNEMSMFQHLSSALGQNVADAAKEYVSILESFTFAKWVMRHDPVVYSMLFSPAEGARLLSGPRAKAEWKVYKKISHRLTCYFDNNGGVLRLRYVASDRETAERMLTIIVNDLIADVRDRDIATYTAQIKSLQDHANHTSDELLRADLYEIIAKRMEQLTTAEASALTTFRIIEAPYVPIDPYQPMPLLYSAVAAGAMPILLFTLLVVIERARVFLLTHADESSPMPNGLDHTGSALNLGVSEQSPENPS